MNKCKNCNQRFSTTYSDICPKCGSHESKPLQEEDYEIRTENYNLFDVLVSQTTIAYSPTTTPETNDVFSNKSDGESGGAGDSSEW